MSELLNDLQQFRDKLAIALSAFGNSGGGHIILGQRDDGTFDGVDAMYSRGGNQTNQPSREWLEQVLPSYVQFPLQAIRVHVAKRADSNSLFPQGKEIIVVDVGDSPLAPHQAIYPTNTPNYYRRVGGHSVVAPHHYIELLRSRITSPLLRPRLNAINMRRAFETPCAIELELVFHVHNTTRIAAREWALSMEYVGFPAALNDVIPTLGARNNIVLYDTLLPTQSRIRTEYVGVLLDIDRPLLEQVGEIIANGIVKFTVLTESSIGAEEEQPLSSYLTVQDMQKTILRMFKDSGVVFK